MSLDKCAEYAELEVDTYIIEHALPLSHPLGLSLNLKISQKLTSDCNALAICHPCLSANNIIYKDIYNRNNIIYDKI